MRTLLRPAAFLLCVVITATMFSACSKKASPNETIANTFIDSISGLYDKGTEYDNDGLIEVANYLYGTAAADVSSIRYAVDCLLYMKGEGSTLADVVGDRLGDWDKIAALGYASPYPYIFEGITDEADGKTDAANQCYEKAAGNPNMLENSEYLKTITLLDKPALEKLKTKLTALEDKIFAAYTPGDISIPRSENNFSDVWLRAQGRAVLDKNPNDYQPALQYYLAALGVNPYDGDNYAGVAVLYMSVEDSQSAIRYLNDGLFIDPQNKSLNAVLKTLKGVTQ